MEKKTETAARVIVHGKVQQVGYRMWTVAKARDLGLRGWVRNRADGTVEALLIGDADAVDDMAEKCTRGPRLAEVAMVERELARDDGAQGFEQVATA